MKLSLNILIMLLIQVNCSIWTRADDIKCEEDMFDIVIKETNVNFVTVQIVFEIKLKKSISNKNLSEYASKCLEEIIFEYKKSGEVGVKTKIEKFNGKLNSSVSFYDLAYLSEYEFNIKYVQKNGFKYDVRNPLKINTCFGQPSELTNFTWIEKGNQVEINWNPPQIINAPKVCSYHIFVIKRDKKEMNLIVQSDTKYIYNGNLTNTELLISAYNEEQCYKADNPNVDKCVNKNAFGPYSIVFKDETKQTIASTESTKQTETSTESTIKSTGSSAETTSGTAGSNTTNKNKNKSNILISNINVSLFIPFLLAVIVNDLL